MDLTPAEKYRFHSILLLKEETKTVVGYKVLYSKMCGRMYLIPNFGY